MRVNLKTLQFSIYTLSKDELTRNKETCAISYSDLPRYDIKPWVACSCLRTLPFCILEAMSREKTWPPSLHVWESVQSFIEHRVVLSLGEFQRRQTRR